MAVLSNPYFQVTQKEGKFDLKNLPPGTYTLVAWHELYGPSEQTVTVGPKETKAVTLRSRPRRRREIKLVWPL